MSIGGFLSHYALVGILLYSLLLPSTHLYLNLNLTVLA